VRKSAVDWLVAIRGEKDTSRRTVLGR